MTNDLISRSALKDKFVAMRECAQTFIFKTIFGDLIEVIEQEPAVDAAPAVEGDEETQSEWIDVPNYSYSWDEIMRRTICQKCGGMVKWHYGEEHRYCYHCGAKMKEGK